MAINMVCLFSFSSVSNLKTRGQDYLGSELLYNCPAVPCAKCSTKQHTGILIINSFNEYKFGGGITLFLATRLST